MSAEKVASSRETLTYFGPLKDENILPSSSNVLQFVYNFFGTKRGGTESQKKIRPDTSKDATKSPSRPNALDLASQKGKRRSSYTNHDPGSEVELRLRSLSSMLWEFPKLMKAGAPNEQESNDEQGANISPIPSSAELRQYWMPDEQCHECYECGEKFTTFRRRHHCRICGQIFCSRCCNQLISGKFMGHPGMLRSCTYCCKLVLTFAQGNISRLTTPSFGHSSTTPNLDAVADDSSRDISSASDTALSYGNAPANGLSNLQSSSANNGRRQSSNSGKFRHDLTFLDDTLPLGPGIGISSALSPGRDLRAWKQPSYIFDATPDVSMLPEPDPEVEHELVQDSAQLHLLWRRISDEKDGLEFRDHRFRLRKYSSCFTGQELVDWLLRKDVASTRAQALAIGQALFEGKWLKPIMDIGGVFQDGYVLFQSGNKHSAAFGANKIEIYPDHFANFSGEETDGDTICNLTKQEPMWVQEIQCEDEDVQESDEFFERVSESDFTYMDGHANFDESLIYSDDDRSISEKSMFSLSSFVEIDEDNDIIKYRRRCSSAIGESFTANQSRAMHSPQPNFDDSGLTSISADYLRSFLTWHGTLLNQPWLAPSSGWREASLQSAFVSSRDKKAFQWLREAYLGHNLAFLKQLLHDRGLDLAWAEVLVPLAKHAADLVSTNPDVNIDVCHYVQIKKLMDDPENESQVVNGVVCTKNVVHKHMQTDVVDPSILLLAIPLEYQRVQLKLATLDPIVRQEREFYKHLVSRITARQPHVVLVQCTVSHIAQEFLLQAGVTLIINVKPSVMERVARSTEADIVYSIDQLMQAKLGKCSRFYIKHHINRVPCSSRREAFETDSTVKTLMYLDGCNPAYGCTIMLRRLPKAAPGCMTKQELVKVKAVLRFLIQAMYHARLELSYLIDQQEFGLLLKKIGSKKNGQKIRASLSHVPKSLVSTENGEYSNGLSDVNGRKAVAVDGMQSGKPANDTDGSPPKPSEFDKENNEKESSAPSSDSHSPLRNPESVPLASSSDDTVNPVPKSCVPLNTPGRPFSHDAFTDSLKTTLLSTSPLIRPKLPFLYSEPGLTSSLHQFLPRCLFWSRRFNQKCLNGQNEAANHTREGQQGFRSRSNTTESLLQEKIWLSPAHQHQKANSSAEQEDGNISLGNIGGELSSSRDVLNEEALTPTVRREKSGSRTSCYSQHFKHHHRDVSTSSADSMIGSGVYVRLHTWEQKLMDQVFPATIDLKQMPDSSPLSPVTSIRTSTPVPDADPDTPADGDAVNTALDFHTFIRAPLQHPATSDHVKDLLASFRAHAGMVSSVTPKSKWPPAVTQLSLKSGDTKMEKDSEQPSFPYSAMEPVVPSVGTLPTDCMDPANHQHIFALFSSYSTQSPNAPYPCVLPWVVDIEFYRGNDITLGGFLERYCFRPSYHCPNSTCRRPMVEHVRSFVHGATCLTIVLKELSKPFQQSSILTWNWNHLTQKSSEIKTMSHDAWSMSFAKYLELRLEDLGIPESSSSSDNVNILDQEVELMPFTSFQYFLYRDIVAAFKCFPISINEVVFPLHVLVQCQKNHSHHTHQLGDDISEDPSSYSSHLATVRGLSEKTYEVLDAILVCINTACSNRPAGSSDSLSEEIQSARDRFFDDLLVVLSEERSHLREEVDSIQLLVQSSCSSLPVSDSMKNVGFEDSMEAEERSNGVSLPKGCHLADEELVKVFSSRILKLKCNLCTLVESWNQKLEEINERERNLGWGVAGASTGSSPLLPKRTAIGAPIHEEEAPLLSADEERSNITNSSVSKVSTAKILAGVIQEEGSPPDENVECEQEKVLAPLRPQSRKQKMSFSSESKNSTEKSSSYRRMSRTGSSMRLLVTRLLPGNTLIPSVPMPFPSDEHYLLSECVSSNIVVRDAEPASIIAYALNSEKYKHAVLDNNLNTGLFDAESAMSFEADEKTVSPKHPKLSVSCTSSRSASPSSMLRSPDATSNSEGQSENSKSISRDDNTAASNNSVISLSTKSSIPVTPSHSPHVEVQFTDHTTKFYCKVYFATMFEAFREKVLKGGEEQYLDSMSRSIRWVARGGKSGSTFHKTRDDQFVLKQMSYFELQSFIEFAPKYVDYITNSIENQETTTISKILGVYRISFRNSETNRSMKQDVLIIENLFYQRKIGQIFDLKGSVRNRHVKDVSPVPSDGGCATDHNDIVLLDENLLKLMSENPLYVHEHTKHLLKSAITRDTNFLSANLIMDYSLLVGVEGDQIVVGIIDFIRTFTWDKKLEMVVKSYGMFGGRKQTNKTMPTVVSPELYKNRFCEAMDRYFQVVPDRWYAMHAY